ncbi:hypothetical protein F9856_01090 [Streptococcus suis]|nr:hypothetical protein [Streptococcus suis]
MGVRKNSIGQKRVRLLTPAQLIRSDLEYEIRTNLPINHCAEMLTRTLRSEAGLFTQPLCYYISLNNFRKIFGVMLCPGPA